MHVLHVAVVGTGSELLNPNLNGSWSDSADKLRLNSSLKLAVAHLQQRGPCHCHDKLQLED